jgi:hypothetical protein
VPTRFQLALASTAQQQFDKYHLYRENQPPLDAQVARYWTDIGFPFVSVQVAWSAVFVSWCVHRAGATALQFHFADAHSVFVYWAIQNAQNNVGDFRGHDVAAYAPKVGDILHNNRSGNHFDFAYASANRHYESHSAVVIEVGADNAGRYLRTIGGNESDSVGMKEVRLSAAGKVLNASRLYISVIETLL